MRVLLIGAGAREHALAEKILESPSLTQLYWLPGNAALEGMVTKVADIDPCDGPRLAIWAQRQEIDLAVIGPEAPLLAGVSDCLEEVGVPCFGPSKKAALLEGSKAFAKDLMAKSNIPTAKYVKVSGPAEAVAALSGWQAPVVIKADGLAAGKGVTVAMSMEEALGAAKALEGPAVIEEFLQGRELSFMVLVQGRRYIPLVPSRDHKRAGDGDTGANTGGMGAVAGFGLISQGLQQEICTGIITPTLEAMEREGRPFKGLLYAGLILTNQGVKVLEYNVRFGDPETQAVLELWEDDILEVFYIVARGGLPSKLLWSGNYAISLVLASGGYPEKYQTGHPIRGIEAVQKAHVFQAGTTLVRGRTVTAGGRVLTLAAREKTLALAREIVYAGAEQVHFKDKQFRTDIGC